MEDNKKLELNDEMLENVSGGMLVTYQGEECVKTKYCEDCKCETLHRVGASSLTCTRCGKVTSLY